MEQQSVKERYIHETTISKEEIYLREQQSVKERYIHGTTISKEEIYLRDNNQLKRDISMEQQSVKERYIHGTKSVKERYIHGTTISEREMYSWNNNQLRRSHFLPHTSEWRQKTPFLQLWDNSVQRWIEENELNLHVGFRSSSKISSA